jgi:hypothetical protein
MLIMSHKSLGTPHIALELRMFREAVHTDGDRFGHLISNDFAHHGLSSALCLHDSLSACGMGRMMRRQRELTLNRFDASDITPYCAYATDIFNLACGQLKPQIEELPLQLIQLRA